jgi:hypothetical protein
MSQSIEQVRAQVKALKEGDKIRVTYRTTRAWPYRKTEIFYFVGRVKLNNAECLEVSQIKGPPWMHPELIPLEDIDDIIRL